VVAVVTLPTPKRRAAARPSIQCHSYKVVVLDAPVAV
jgi:hypothetical protein